MLRPTPKKPNVVVTAKEITIKQQIQFALDSAVILPDSFGLLTEIADTIIRHTEIKRVEVQGHTDNSGTPEHNKVLSEQRAEAVVAWLAQHGVRERQARRPRLRPGEAARPERHRGQPGEEPPRAVHHPREGRLGTGGRPCARGTPAGSGLRGRRTPCRGSERGRAELASTQRQASSKGGAGRGLPP